MIKKIILFFMLAVLPLYGVEITKVSNLDFGEVVRGDKYVKLRNIRVYVKGEPEEKVKIYYPESFETEAGELLINVRQEEIRLSNNGRGKFTLDCKLNLRNNVSAGNMKESIPISVSYK